MSATSRASLRQWVLWTGVLLATIGVLLAFRSRLDKAHVALVFLLVVLGGSAAGGRLLGLALAAAAFVAFDVGFLPPYNALRVSDPLDWIVLFAFLVTGIVAAQLLERQRREAEIARARTAEIDRLATLGAETLNAPRPEDALRAIADVIRQSMGTDRCDITPTVGTKVAIDDGATASAGEIAPPLPSREMRLPLVVRQRTVGTLTLSADRPFLLSDAQQRVLAALSYYAALGVERLHLAAAEDETEALRRADRLKDALLASVSHDLRTPLTTIKGIANQIVREGDPGLATVIEEEVDRLTALVNDLLDLSQLTAGEMPLVLAVNTADEVVGAALQLVEHAFPGRRIETVLEGPWTDLIGRFDLAHTMRVLVNLLENGAKYAPEGTSLTLRVWRAGRELRFAVEDEGEGIPAPERERIFTPFVRGAGRARTSHGTGLGLSIARQLATVQGGRLEYEAGARSRFVLTLPAEDAPTE